MRYLDYNEKKEHGTRDFPLEFYHVDKDHPRYEMPFHWHRELEIIRILEGHFTAYLNDQVIDAAKGDFLFINQGVIHGGIPSGCTYECIVFDPSRLLMATDACRSYLRSLSGEKGKILPFFKADAQPFSDAAGNLFEAAKRTSPGKELAILGCLFQLFGIIYDFHYYMETEETPLPNSEKINTLKPVLEYIDKNYMHPLMLDDLAKLAGMSSRYFCRFFYAFIHRTPMDYLNYYRIEQACCLLAASVPVTETAYRCGFNDSSYFVKIFKKYKEMTPGQYQRLYR